MRPMRRALLTVGLLAPLCRGLAQSPASLADLRWSAAETSAGRFVIVPGKRSFVGGYNTPGLEIWTYPLQLVRHYWVSFRLEGDTSDVDGRVALRTIEQTPTGATRVYTAPGITLREHVFAPVDLPAATISYAAESSRPVLITVHFTPSLNLMWPGAIGGQEIHWDSTHSAYTLDEPSRRVRARWYHGRSSRTSRSRTIGVIPNSSGVSALRSASRRQLPATRRLHSPVLARLTRRH